MAPRRTAGRLMPFLWLLYAGLSVNAAKLPYIPTQILMPSACFDEDKCAGKDVAYVFQTNDDDDVQFLGLDYSKNFDSDTKLDTLSSKLPFLEDGDDTRTFAAARAGDGTVVVYAGDCDAGPGKLWSFSTKDQDWEEISMQQMQTDQATRGPFFMGGTVAFSPKIAPVMDDPTIYTYGGMCTSPVDASSDWQSAGNYTKTMMSLEPPKDDDDGDTSYVLGVASTSGPKTPMAGFSMTGLTPSMSNVSGTVTQQVGYVLLGGHTQMAFINMSTAAVWKLPEESWSYVSIQPPDSEPSGELALKAISRRAADNVYSRSGHSAVLSADGQSIVILGGWVGDVDTPAEPQLGILEMTDAYSGWKWSIPKNQPDESLYGHAAAMLPGDVMMVYGGREIGEAAARKKRQAGGSGIRFLNVTSMEWSSSYTNPGASLSTDSDDSENGSNKGSNESDDGTKDNSKDAPDSNNDSSKTVRLGIGLGLGLGLGLLVLLIIGLACCWRIRKRKRHAAREEAVRSLQQDASHFRHDEDEMAERDDYYPWPGSWYTGGHDAYSGGERSLGYESLRGNRGGVTMGNAALGRKAVPRQMRGGYVPAATGAGGYGLQSSIHPILEDEEDDYAQTKEPQTPTSEIPDDPFATPTAQHAPVLPPVIGNRSLASSPTFDGANTRRYDPDVQDWVSDADAAETMLVSMNSRRGRKSPTRRNSARSSALRDDDSRHGSNLSESSSRLSPTGRRTNFTGSSGLLAGSTVLAGSDAQKPGSSSSSSYATAKSAFGVLQAEGPSLLLGTGQPSPGYDEDDAPSSPSKSKPRRSWFGSLRRVFSTSEGTSPASSMRDGSPRRPSFEYAPSDYEVRPGLSGELLRRKQGRHDWDSDNIDGGKDWDIEKAVENRLVQVMFSVPKERLRVVNPDDEDADAESIKRPLTAEFVDPGTTSESPRPVSPLTPEPEGHEEQDLGLLRVDTRPSMDAGSSDRRHSALSMVSSEGRSEARIEVAEAVKVERPKTRVLQMVDNFESKSREGSPSPTRSFKGAAGA